MESPCRLYRLRSGEIVETVPPGASATFLIGKGAPLIDSEARRLGITEYLQRRGAATVTTKAVEQDEVEDKAVSQDEVEDKGLVLQDRSRGRR